MLSMFHRRGILLAAVLGFCDGILTALTLTAGRLTGTDQAVTLGFASRIATGALGSGAFVFFVARYSELRQELIRSEQQLNLLSHGQLARSKLGIAIRNEAIAACATSSVAAFCGALVPMLAAALVPRHGWVAILVALFTLGSLGFGLARVVHGSRVRWPLGLIIGGILLSLLGSALKIA